jgi:hypothetical protein
MVFAAVVMVRNSSVGAEAASAAWPVHHGSCPSSVTVAMASSQPGFELDLADAGRLDLVVLVRRRRS